MFDPDPLIYPRPVNGAFKALIKKGSIHATLNTYIQDYLKQKESDIAEDMLCPMDYLWRMRRLDLCSESEMTFWICRFIIDSCLQIYNYGYVDESPYDYIVLENTSLKTQEDLYYYAILMLYLTFHTAAATPPSVHAPSRE